LTRLAADRGIINTFGAFETYYVETILSQHSPSTIAWIGSLESFFLLMFGVIIGPLFDAGYLHAILIFGTFMVTFGLLMTSVATELWHFVLAQGVCIGLAAGALFVPSIAILPQYFQSKRALVSGIAASGSSFGGVIYPIMFHKLQSRVGFAWTTRILGCIALGTCCISLSVMRMRFKPTEKRRLVQLSAFKELPFVLSCIALFLAFLGLYNFMVYIEGYAILTGIVDNNFGFYLLPMLNAASTFGRVIPNIIADYTGALNMLPPTATISAILAFVWISVHSKAGIITLTVLYGFFSGGYVSLPPIVMISITKDLRDLGTRLGMCFSIASIALLIGTPIGGAILNDTHHFLGLQLFCGGCLIASAIILAVLRFVCSGPRLFVKV
jgi:predicted MFS family arabinose efflux permease